MRVRCGPDAGETLETGEIDRERYIMIDQEIGFREEGKKSTDGR